MSQKYILLDQNYIIFLHVYHSEIKYMHVAVHIRKDSSISDLKVMTGERTKIHISSQLLKS